MAIFNRLNLRLSQKAGPWLNKLCSKKNYNWTFFLFPDLEKSILFEVSCMDISQLCITFEISQDQGGMACLEIDFTDLRNVQSKMHKMSNSTKPSPESITDVNQACHTTKTIFER